LSRSDKGIEVYPAAAIADSGDSRTGYQRKPSANAGGFSFYGIRRKKVGRENNPNFTRIEWKFLD